MLPPTFFSNNRRTLQKRLPDDSLVVMCANGLMQRSGDTLFPFRQDSNFYYLTGLSDLADAVLVINGDTEFLIVPKRTDEENTFGGFINCEEIAKKSGITTVLVYKEGWDRVKKMQQSRKKIHTLGAMPTKIVHLDSFYTNPARRQLIAKLKRLNAHVEIVDIRRQLIEMRQIKQPEEIEAIKAAIEVTKHGIAAAREFIKVGAKEYEFEAIFDFEFKKRNSNHGFTPVISVGANTCVLHHIKKTGVVDTGDFVLFDVGAEVGLYAADISRTYVATSASQRQQAVYDAVASVQKDATLLLKSGISWRDYVIRVDEIMGEQLIDLGLITKNTRAEVHRYFSHGISHSLGLDVHDVCDYSKLQENMVITVEPGIYIPEEGIGVRIEDDVLITKSGAINLSEDIPY